MAILINSVNYLTFLGRPALGVTVTAYNSSNSVVGQTITGLNGYYNLGIFNLPVGTYSIRYFGNGFSNIPSEWNTYIVYPVSDDPALNHGIGTSSQFIKGDGSLDSTAYVTGTPWTSMGYLTSLTGALVTSGSATGAVSQSQVFTTGITLSNLSSGSVLFVTASGVVSQDNTGLFYDSTNHRLGIGTTSPTRNLEVSTGERITRVSGGQPFLEFVRSDNSGNASVISALDVYGQNSTPANVQFSSIQSQISSNTASSEQGIITFRNIDAGVLSDRLTIKGSNVGIGTTAPTYRTQIVGSQTRSAVVFTGIGLNDATAGGAETSSKGHTYTIIIDGTAPDTFKWQVDSGSFTTGVAITGSVQTLTNGITITFGATTGHTSTDQWVITTTTVNPLFVLGGSGVNGLYVANNGYVGINNSNPSQPLVISTGSTTALAGSINATTTFTNPAAGAYTDNAFTTNIGLTGNNAGATNYYVMQSIIQTGADSNTYNSGTDMRSFSLTAKHNGTQTFADMRGLWVDEYNTGAGTVSNMKGIDLNSRNTGAGTITNYCGLFLRDPTNSGGGAITNWYGIQVPNITQFSTIARGLDLNLASGTGKYNVYAGGTASNYFGGNVTFAGQYSAIQYTTTTTLDWNNRNVQYIQLASGGQTFTFANPIGGARYVLIVKQPSAGAAGTVTWPITVKWPSGNAPTLTTTNNKVDMIGLLYDSVNSVYYATAGQNF